MTDMQERSWANANGSSGWPGLVGQVFFLTGSADLDQEDRQALQGLVARYRMLALGHRIEVLCVGHADQRGGTGSNQDLGSRRAGAVRQFLATQLESSGNFSTHPAVSRGEGDAARGEVSPERMARDRRVDLRCNYIPNHQVRMAPIAVTGARPVGRIRSRVFASTRTEDHTGMMQGTNPNFSFDRAWDALAGMNLLGPAENSLGTERLLRRQVVEVPVIHRVNALRIHKATSYRSTSAATITASETTVTYTWGVPAENIDVTRIIVFNNATTHETRRSETSSRVSRASVAGNTLFFPPDPRSVTPGARAPI